MTVEGELDDISGSGQTEAALAMCTGVSAAHKKHFEAKGAGHYGIFSGRRWRELVYPAVKAFILEANKDIKTPSKTVPKLPLAQSKPAQAAPKKIALVAPAKKPVIKAVVKPATKTVIKAAVKRVPAKAVRSK